MDPDPLLLQLLISDHLMLMGIMASMSLVGLLILLLMGSALISASEVAYFSLTPGDVQLLTKGKNKRDSKILALKESPRKLLATILITNNFINIAIVILSDSLLKTMVPESTFEAWAGQIISSTNFTLFTQSHLADILSISITVIAVTFLLVLFGEVAPKIYANLNNVRHARAMATPMSLLNKVCYPFNAILVNWSSGIEERVYQSRLYSKGTDKKGLDRAIELTVQEGESREEVDILKGIIKFGDVTTKQIMRSRVDVISLDTSDSFKDVLATIKESGYSRIPVTEEDFDTVKGILYVKDLLGHSNESEDFNWQELVRENVLYIPETKKIDELMKEFQLKRTHIGIVVDEYGGSSGIVTLEDIVEEVVGEIRDEFDSDDVVDYSKIDEYNYLFEGKTLLNDVVRIINMDNDVFEDKRGIADSLAGFILEIEGMIPKLNKVIKYKNIQFKIMSVTKRRIEQIHITLPK